jgi:hypothetical protein
VIFVGHGGDEVGGWRGLGHGAGSIEKPLP